MGLVRKVKLTSVSSDGRIITITDITGNYNSSTNITGYGAPNPAISSFLSLFIQGIYINGSQFILTSTNSTITQAFLNNGDLALTSAMAPDLDGGSYPFKDGVVNIYTYACQAPSAVTGYAGDSFITVADTTELLAAGYFVANNVAYQIDTTNTSNSGTVAYLKNCTLQGDITSLTVAYMACVYAMIEAEFICKLTNAIAAMAGKDGDEIDKAGILSDILVKKYNADFAFPAKDYQSADFSIRTGITRLNRLLHG